MQYTDILPKYAQYEDIPYAADLQCQDCGKGNFDNWGEPGYMTHAPIAVGWCDTPIGYMGIFECPICHSKFRFHCGGNMNDELDWFNLKFHQWIFMCQNYQELNTKLKQK
jgi:hypothetical protein